MKWDFCNYFKASYRQWWEATIAIGWYRIYPRFEPDGTFVFHVRYQTDGLHEEDRRIGNFSDLDEAKKAAEMDRRRNHYKLWDAVI